MGLAEHMERLVGMRRAIQISVQNKMEEFTLKT
jgi:hypothetical protein